MLENTFLHIQGIGLKTERQLWKNDVRDWHSFLQNNASGFSAAKTAFMRDHILESRLHLANNPSYFSERLPASQHWRIFPHFRDDVAFVDIETTGLDGFSNQITTIALYDGRSVSYYVHGENLDDFLDDICKYKIIITYNGKCFDIPFIERFFRTRLQHSHIDLRYVLHSLGYRGGLKGCEKQLGLDRGELDGVDGYFAVLLWQEYMRTGDEDFLYTLLAYNILDTVNLEVLMIKAYNLLVAQTPFANALTISEPSKVQLPVEPSIRVVEYVKQKYYRMGAVS